MEPPTNLPTKKQQMTLCDTQESIHFPNLYFSVVRVSQLTRAVDIETVFPFLKTEYKNQPLFAVVTVQPTTVDMSQFTDEAQLFKDQALKVFLNFLSCLRKKLITIAAKSQQTKDIPFDDVATTVPNSPDRVGPAMTKKTTDGDEGPATVEPLAPCEPSPDECLGDGFWLNAGDPVSGWPLFGCSGSTLYDEVGGLETFAPVSKVPIATPWGVCHLAKHRVFGLNMYPATLFVVCTDQEILLNVLNEL